MYAFCDGSNKDGEYFRDVAKHRRTQISADQAIGQVVGYLKSLVDVLEKDMARYRAKKDVERYHAARERKEWAQGMIFWVNHNV